MTKKQQIHKNLYTKMRHSSSILNEGEVVVFSDEC